jgi:hypothetical protein
MTFFFSAEMTTRLPALFALAVEWSTAEVEQTAGADYIFVNLLDKVVV